jgi:hypothetical protein
MRFYFGNAPEARLPSPLSENWQELSALGAKRVQNFGLLAACAGMLLVGILLRGAFRASTLWTTVLVLIITPPLHELIHALTTPAWGSTDRIMTHLPLYATVKMNGWGLLWKD